MKQAEIEVNPLTLFLPLAKLLHHLMHIIRHVTQSMEDLPQDWNYHELDFPCLRVVFKHKNGGLQRPPHG